MKALLGTTAYLVLVLPATAIAQGQQINIIFTAENASCSAWSKSADNKLVRAHYEFWARGFVSGHNFANPAQQVKLGAFPGSDAFYQYLDQYCRDKPQNSFVDGTIQLVRSLREPAGAPKKATTKSAPAAK